jgi:hypothetical protein
MKRKFYALMLVVAMLAMALVGCGSDTTDTTNTTNDVTVNTEIEESGEVVEPEVEVDVPETEVPEVETTEEPTTEEDDFYADSYQWEFPEGMDGFTDKYVLASDETMSFNCTHYVDVNGNEMNFSWVGPTELGEKAGVNSNTLNLKEKSDTYEIRAWHSGSMRMEDIEPCLTADSTAWTNSTSAYCSLPENGYYNVEQVENTVIITYELIDNASGKMGYARFLANADVGEMYCFIYLETPEVFDNTRAMNVVESFDFWTYNPGEIVTE